jgi:hypothetical protein
MNIIITHMEATLRQNLTWTNLKKDVEAAVNNCHEWEIGKKVRMKYGDLLEKLAERPIAWNRADVYLIGPLNKYSKWIERIVSINNDRPLNRLV